MTFFDRESMLKNSKSNLIPIIFQFEFDLHIRVEKSQFGGRCKEHTTYRLQIALEFRAPDVPVKLG